MIGRECLECKKYFKIKPGTGLPTSYCHCPYCDYEGESSTFWTNAQNKYVRSVALKHAYNKVLGPALDDIMESFKDLERSTRNSFIKFKVTTSKPNFYLPIKHYSEKDLETTIICDSCGLVFSIYGVFARCPDCNELNAFLIFEKSIEVTQKHFDIIFNSNTSKEIKDNSLVFILSSCVAAFDGLGKELRKRRPELYSDKPKNIFQNLTALNKSIGESIANKHSDFNFLLKMFQIRHIYEHNMGVIDEDFIKKIPGYTMHLDRKHNLTKSEIEKFVLSMRELGNIIKDHYKNTE
jgi:hypothetical protein